jgi:hypothetical protein
MTVLAIIWFHIRSCAADLRARRLGDLTIDVRRGGQVVVENEHKEWRLR